MSVATHRQKIVDVLRLVAAVGVVHDEEPYIRTEQALRQQFTYDTGSGQQLRGWWVRRERTVEQALALGRTLNTHSWVLRGFMALDAEAGSGKAFDDLIEAMRRPFRLDPTLDGVAEPGPLERESGLQLVESGPVMFCGTLCHGARLRLTTYEFLDEGE